MYDVHPVRSRSIFQAIKGAIEMTKHRRGLICPVTVRATLIVALMCCAAARADAADDLYRTQTIVTGQGEANRIIGFAACLEDVLIKVSGALKLAGDPRLNDVKSHARDFVTAYDYHDQMSGKPKRDEQGTRDRPYDLIVDFDARKIDDILGGLGLKPWSSQRPRLGVLVEMEQGARKFIVTSDTRQSELQRESLVAAAIKRGMIIALPDAAALAKSNIGDASNIGDTEVMTMSSAAWRPVAAAQGADIALLGHLTWSDTDLGWVTEWRMDWQDRPHRWQLRGVTFDEAFRRGIGGAAQILSGNGDPN
jgi:uncharacterized protein